MRHRQSSETKSREATSIRLPCAKNGTESYRKQSERREVRSDLVADGRLAGEIIQQHGDEGRLCHDGGVGGDGSAGHDVRARAVATRRAATRTNTLRCQTQSSEKI